MRNPTVPTSKIKKEPHAALWRDSVVAFGLTFSFVVSLLAQSSTPGFTGVTTHSTDSAITEAHPASAIPLDPGYQLGPDDQLKIWVLGVDEIAPDKPVRVDPSGNMDLPLIGKVHVGGLTLPQLKDELVRLYSKEVMHPEVSVGIVEYGSQPISVLGAVNHAGVQQLQGRKTLMEVLSAAEGLKPDAGTRVTIAREIQNGPIPLLGVKTDPTGKYSVAELQVKDILNGTHPAENILVLPRDVITVPPQDTVYVIGAVKKPGEMPVRSDGMTVLQALSSAEGLGPAPAAQSAKIVRIEAGTAVRQEIPVNLKEILAGKREDVVMRPNDILYVPSSIAKIALTRSLEAAIQAATGIAMYGRF